MQLSIIESNILDVESDALIYSTNTKLLLSGGVGACLVENFGSNIQTKLINQSSGFGIDLAEIGDVYSCKTENMPWKKVIHTVCSDSSYIIDLETIENVLIKSLKLCNEDPLIKTISISALGTGYGTIHESEFIESIKSICKNNNFDNIDEIFICLIEGNRH